MREFEREREREIPFERKRGEIRKFMNILCLLSIDCFGLLLYGKSNNYQIRTFIDTTLDVLFILLIIV